MKIIIGILSVFFSQIIIAQDKNTAAPAYGELKGYYILGGINIVDPGGEPQDTHFYLKITGDAANKLFTSIKNDSTHTNECYFKNECFTFEHKQVDQVKCHRETTYNIISPAKCFITIDFENNKLVQGVDIDKGDL